MQRPSTAIFFASLLILPFAYTAFSKLFSQASFISALRQMPLIAPGAAVAAWLVPLTELAIVLLLFMPSTRINGFYAALMLLALFTAYIGGMMVFAPQLPCSCGGVTGSLGWGEHLVLNGAFMALAVVGVWMEQRIAV